MKSYRLPAAHTFRALLVFVTCLFAFATLSSRPAGAKPPVLEKPQNHEYPGEVLTGEQLEFEVAYHQDSGDKPRILQLLIEIPGGGVTKLQPDHTTGDPATVMTATWFFTPRNTGDYKFHFETTSVTGETARFPQDASADDQFSASNLYTKYIILAVGLVVALWILPFIVYLGTRAINRKSDPTIAARIAFAIGVLAWIGLFIGLFSSVYSWPIHAIVIIAGAALLLVLFTRRKH